MLYNAFKHYGISIEPGTPVLGFNEGQKAILLYGVESDEVRKFFPDQVPLKRVAEGRFEGVLPILWRRVSEKGGGSELQDAYFDSCFCPDCRGERLKELSRNVL